MTVAVLLTKLSLLIDCSAITTRIEHFLLMDVNYRWTQQSSFRCSITSETAAIDWFNLQRALILICVAFVNIDQYQYQMRIGKVGRVLYYFVLITTILYTGLHIALAVYALRWRDDVRTILPNSYLDQVYAKELLRQAIFIFATAGTILFLAVTLLLASCANSKPRGRHILASFLAMLVLVLGVVLLLSNRQNSDLIDFTQNIVLPIGDSFFDQYESFRTYYRLGGDWIGCFVLTVLTFLFVYWPTLKQMSYRQVLAPVLFEGSPASDRNL